MGIYISGRLQVFTTAIENVMLHIMEAFIFDDSLFTWQAVAVQHYFVAVVLLLLLKDIF